MIGSFPIMFFLVYKCVSDTNYFTEAHVIPPTKVLQAVEANFGEKGTRNDSIPADTGKGK